MTLQRTRAAENGYYQSLPNMGKLIASAILFCPRPKLCLDEDTKRSLRMR